MIKDCIKKLVECKNLSAKECRAAFTEIMRGTASPAQIGAFLVAMRMKGETAPERSKGLRIAKQSDSPRAGETAQEIASAAMVMGRFMCSIKPHVMGAKAAKGSKGKGGAGSTQGVRGMLLDTCGTGGDRIRTFNISTAAAFVAAGAGCAVAKHGNRAVSGRFGSADVLEALGVKIELQPAKVKEIIEEAGIGFLFAPLCHAAMRYAAQPRREIGIRTVFNILGPIANPANAQARLIGAYSAETAEKIAKVLQLLRVKRALVVHGVDGLDEISTIGKTIAFELRNGKITKHSYSPKDFGMKKANAAGLAPGATAQSNAQMVVDVLKGKKGPRTDIVLLNAGAAIYVTGLARSIGEGIGMARESVESGRAMEKLDLMRKLSNKI